MNRSGSNSISTENNSNLLDTFDITSYNTLNNDIKMSNDNLSIISNEEHNQSISHLDILSSISAQDDLINTLVHIDKKYSKDLNFDNNDKIVYIGIKSKWYGLFHSVGYDLYEFFEAINRNRVKFFANSNIGDTFGDKTILCDCSNKKKEIEFYNNHNQQNESDQSNQQNQQNKYKDYNLHTCHGFVILEMINRYRKYLDIKKTRIRNIVPKQKRFRNSYNVIIGNTLKSDNNSYCIERILSGGASGIVCLCKMNETSEVVIKIHNASRKYFKFGDTESSILKKLKNIINNSATKNLVENEEDQYAIPNIIDSFQIESAPWAEYSKHYCLVMNRYGSDLFDYLLDTESTANYNRMLEENIPQNVLELDDIKYIAKQLLNTLDLLHNQMNMTHGDIKPENILVKDINHNINSDPFDIILIDYGLSVFTDNNTHLSGTHQYMSPEEILEYGWGKPSDIWSVGLVLFEIYTGMSLFRYENISDNVIIMKRILRDFPHIPQSNKYICTKTVKENFRQKKYRFDPEGEILNYNYFDNKIKDKYFKDFIKSCLQVNPNKRPTAKELLLHPFILDDIDFYICSKIHLD